MDNFKSVRELPFSEQEFLESVELFFHRPYSDFENTLKGVNFDKHMFDLVEEKREKGNLTYNDILEIYSDPIYVAGNICNSPRLISNPEPKSIEMIEHEFIKGVAYQQNNSDAQKLYALDHGCGTGYYGLLLWRYGYNITLCDLPTPYFNFLKFRCEHAGLDDIKFLSIDSNNLKLQEDYDFVFSFFVMEHLIKPEQVVAVISNHLKEDAIFYLRYDFAGTGLHLSENHKYHSLDDFHCSSKLWLSVLKQIGLVQHRLGKESKERKGMGFMEKIK